MLEQELFQRLSAITPNVYPLQAADDFELPLIVYSVINTIPVRDLSSAIGSAFVTMQIDCYADTYISAKSMAASVKQTLSQWIEVGPVLQDEMDSVDNTTENLIYRTMITVHLYSAGS